MQKNIVIPVALTLLLALGACGSPPGTGGPGDSGSNGGTDAGGQTHDGGGNVTDAGNPGTDGGGIVADAGSPGNDGGTVTDAGTPGTDGGTVTDAGTPGTDGGTVTDAGTPGTDGGTPTDGGTATDGGTPAGPAIHTVFMILMENKNWSDVVGNTNAPYVNNTLLPMAAHAENYTNPANIHPSEPNYLWLEAGTNFGILSDATPAQHHQGTTSHLVTLLNDAGISWRAYEEGIDGTTCPLSPSGNYVPRHNPAVYFDDVTGTLDPQNAYCIAHERPFTELSTDLQNDTVARYDFITPDLCDDMHNDCTTPNGSWLPNSDAEVKQGDTWLSQTVPMILASQAYQNGGLLIITWDESEFDLTKCPLANCPIGYIVLSPYAKVGYSNNIAYDHSSTLRSLEEIFGVSPMLGGAAQATDISDLLTTFP